jgi:hypothetical protein
MSRSDDDAPPICGTFTSAGGEWINHTGTPGKQPVRAAGRGGVGGEPEPAAREPEPPSGGPPPAWKDSRRQDPCVAGAFTCHHCLDAGQVWNVDRASATMIAVTCSCATGSAG